MYSVSNSCFCTKQCEDSTTIDTQTFRKVDYIIKKAYL